MRETLQAMLTRGLLEIVGLILVAAALIYVVLRWSRRSGARPAAMVAARAGSQNPQATEEKSYGRAPTRSVLGLPPRTQKRWRASLRQLWEGCAPGARRTVQARTMSSDEHLGPRGVPGEPAPANTLPENETQMPKPLDPGHTA